MRSRFIDLRKNVFLLGLCAATLFGCTKESDPEPVAGIFRLTPVGIPGTKSTLVPAGNPGTYFFHLGDVKSSREFYFILSNGGDYPVFDIHLETNQLQFSVTPSQISRLSGRDSTDGLIPLIAVGVTHGRQINGVGFAPLLNMGENESTLTITGKTLEGKDTLEIASTFTIGVNAKIMNISAFQGQQEIDLTQPVSVVMGSRNFGGLGAIRYYYVSTPSVTIHNTGNVDINLGQVDFNSNNIYVEHGNTPLPIGQSLEITIDPHLTYIVLESNGTISNDSRIQLGNDGKGYFAIIPQP